MLLLFPTTYFRVLHRRGFILAALILGFHLGTAAPLFAQSDSPSPTPSETPAASAPAHSWVLGLGASLDFPAQDWNPAYTLGYGYSLELASPLQAPWTLALGLTYFHDQGVNDGFQVANDDWRILPAARYFLKEGDLRPYLTGGLGLDLQIASIPGQTAVNLDPDLFLGAGLEKSLADRESVFLEARYNFILAGADLGQDAALSGGLRDSF